MLKVKDLRKIMNKCPNLQLVMIVVALYCVSQAISTIAYAEEKPLSVKELQSDLAVLMEYEKDEVAIVRKLSQKLYDVRNWQQKRALVDNILKLMIMVRRDEFVKCLIDIWPFEDNHGPEDLVAPALEAQGINIMSRIVSAISKGKLTNHEEDAAKLLERIYRHKKSAFENVKKEVKAYISGSELDYIRKSKFYTYLEK